MSYSLREKDALSGVQIHRYWLPTLQLYAALQNPHSGLDGDNVVQVLSLCDGARDWDSCLPRELREHDAGAMYKPRHCPSLSHVCITNADWRTKLLRVSRWWPQSMNPKYQCVGSPSEHGALCTCTGYNPSKSTSTAWFFYSVYLTSNWETDNTINMFR